MEDFTKILKEGKQDRKEDGGSSEDSDCYYEDAPTI